jgi:photosystem II stability/assembly factor-like uncharacterized protein
MPAIYAAMRSGLLGIGGDPPRVVQRLTDHKPDCVAAHPDRPERAFCGTVDAGLWRTRDRGLSWQRVGMERLPDTITAVAASPHDPETLWAGSEPSAVYRSTDGGRTWTERPGLTDLPSADEWSFPPRPDTHHVRWLEPDPHERGRLYVAIEAGALLRTDDGGATWQDRPAGARRDNHTLATHPDAPGHVYVAAGDGYAESDDGGDTWAYPQDGLDHRYVWGLAVPPADPETVVVSAASGAGRAHTADSADSHVYRRVGDEPWSRVNGLPTGAGVTRYVFATHAAAPETIYACSNRGLFRSPDCGATWDPLDVDWPERFTGETARGLAVVGA